MPSFLSRVVILSGLATGLLACTSGNCDSPPSPAVFELGTGESCFQRITAGQKLPTMSGPQGGFHLWLAFGCPDCVERPVIHYGTKDPDTGKWIGEVGEKREVAELGTGEWPQISGLQASLPGDIDAEREPLPTGSHVVLSLSIEDASGAIQHQAETEVVLGEIVDWDG